MEIDFSHLHHAYLLVSSSDEVEAQVQQLFLANGLSLRGSPDYFVSREATFGIKEARALSTLAVRKAFGVKKIFLLLPQSITLEAQNALLKTFEDPIPNTHFFLVVREVESVIPTLRSRMQTLYVKHSIPDNLKSAEKFLSSSVKERLAWVKKFVDNEENLPAFLDELLLLLRSTKQEQAIAWVYRSRMVSAERATSPRLILEHLSVVL